MATAATVSKSGVAAVNRPTSKAKNSMSATHRSMSDDTYVRVNGIRADGNTYVRNSYNQLHVDASGVVHNMAAPNDNYGFVCAQYTYTNNVDDNSDGK